jgi:glutathione synthase/RimK-type ligase-like ATP-grasp enzyme
MLDSVRLAPCQFQEYIQKQSELRVTVIGDDVFAAEIHSQAHEKTSIDWRHYDVQIPYCKATLPSDMIERCLALTRSYNLNFSAMDLVLTPDGRYVFLENNPNGQFIFVENLVPELKMTAALAACLIRGANS